MRARGAKVTDIAIIIVAADDNVMPQTTEAINHASAANVPMIFAINKVDKPGANPEKIKETLAQMNYLVEDWGGKYQSQDVSAKQGQGEGAAGLVQPQCPLCGAQKLGDGIFCGGAGRDRRGAAADPVRCL
jgi:GTPase